MMERIQKLVDVNNQFYPGAPLSFSLGLAICHAGDRIEAAVHEADARMYESKKEYYVAYERDRRKP